MLNRRYLFVLLLFAASCGITGKTAYEAGRQHEIDARFDNIWKVSSVDIRLSPGETMEVIRVADPAKCDGVLITRSLRVTAAPSWMSVAAELVKAVTGARNSR